MKKFALIASGLFVLAVGFLGGCSTGSGGGLDQLAAPFDSGVAARVQLRDAAKHKYQPSALVIAAHNQDQEKLPVEDQRVLLEWWLGENDGRCVEKIGGISLSSICGKYKDLAKHRPVEGTEDYNLWVDTMTGYVELFRSQASVLRAVADHVEKNGSAAQISPADLQVAIGQLRERADLIENNQINFKQGAITASLNPGESKTVVAQAKKSEPTVTARDVNNAAGAASAYNRGNPMVAAQRAGEVVFK